MAAQHHALSNQDLVCYRGPEIAALGERVHALEEDRKRQNGTLQRLEDKMDGIKTMIFTLTASALLAAVGWIVMAVFGQLATHR